MKCAASPTIAAAIQATRAITITVVIEKGATMGAIESAWARLVNITTTTRASTVEGAKTIKIWRVEISRMIRKVVAARQVVEVVIATTEIVGRLLVAISIIEVCVSSRDRPRITSTGAIASVGVAARAIAASVVRVGRHPPPTTIVSSATAHLQVSVAMMTVIVVARSAAAAHKRAVATTASAVNTTTIIVTEIKDLTTMGAKTRNRRLAEVAATDATIVAPRASAQKEHSAGIKVLVATLKEIEMSTSVIKGPIREEASPRTKIRSLKVKMKHPIQSPAMAGREANHHPRLIGRNKTTRTVAAVVDASVTNLPRIAPAITMRRKSEMITPGDVTHVAQKLQLIAVVRTADAVAALTTRNNRTSDRRTIAKTKTTRMVGRKITKVAPKVAKTIGKTTTTAQETARTTTIRLQGREVIIVTIRSTSNHAIKVQKIIQTRSLVAAGITIGVVVAVAVAKEVMITVGVRAHLPPEVTTTMVVAARTTTKSMS
mmetsp:Transcript_1445/g.1978  ORF Transcript_1445/g.1978 Transcript_1445/m.1978 type:complete len:489 (+) Transcript_1445:533-1999(+)